MSVRSLAEIHRINLSYLHERKHSGLHCSRVRAKFLGTFVKLRKANVTFFMSVRLYVPSHEQLGSHWTDFHEISYMSIFRNYIEEM